MHWIILNKIINIDKNNKKFKRKLWQLKYHRYLFIELQVIIDKLNVLVTRVMGLMEQNRFVTDKQTDW